jgi:hypothetical protein
MLRGCMPKWYEFRLWYSSTPNPDELFEFKKTRLLPILVSHNIGYSFMLGEGEFVLVRVEVDEACAKEIQSSLEELLSSQGSPFSRLSMESWLPAEDARNRILNARRAEQFISFRGVPEGGWRVIGLGPNRNWVVEAEQKTQGFASFMSRVAGEFTRAYLEEMPYRVNSAGIGG